MIETKFKPSELGLIPEDWTLYPINRNFSFKRNNTLSRADLNYYDTAGVKNLHYGDILTIFNNFIDASAVRLPFINREIKKNHDLLESGDVIIADTAEDETVGKAVEIVNIPDDEYIVAGLHTIALSPGIKFAPKFLGYFFNVFSFHSSLIPWMQGTKVISISKRAISNLNIAAPNIKEQEKIAEALSDIDSLVRELDCLIEKKRNVMQGTMQDLLTARRRLYDFSKPWQIFELKDILQYEQPIKYLVSSTDYLNNGIPVLTAGKTFILGHTSERDNVYTNLPTIIFDDFTTDSKWVDFPFKAKSSAMKMLTLRNNNFDFRFVYYLMQLIPFKPVEHKRHWIAEYSKIEVKAPTLKEQVAISNILSDMETEIEELEAKRDKYVAIRQGMMQQLLTGKIRLI